ncbi:MAG: hypothetical protein EXR05_02715 [Acetobacteraceae bacterium]|nr:hypothetical protein [Acetobacteraceae bacterium]MSP28905.1 hypothetical protein [Acetobacteraceae bacterium]
MTHKFQIGQAVHLMPGRQDGNTPAGAYTIQRQLPIEGRNVQYRVKNTRDGHERVVPEGQLSAQAGSGWPGG